MITLMKKPLMRKTEEIKRRYKGGRSPPSEAFGGDRNHPKKACGGVRIPPAEPHEGHRNSPEATSGGDPPAEAGKEIR